MSLILIADDEPNMRVSLDYLMRRAGHEVVLAQDGPQALAAIRQVRPALVLLDAVMPGLSGFDVCEAVRADPELTATRILMVSVKARDTDVARGLGAGADGYLTKPFATRDLLDRVAELLA